MGITSAKVQQLLYTTMTSMRQLFLIIGMTLISVLLKAENYPTKFLGIPIDGTKQEMIKKLEEKGFVYDEETDWLTGEFNGKDVILKIRTNNRKVYYVAVIYKYFYTGEEVKKEYNILLKQFENNEQYIPFNLGQEPIPIEEDIDYEIKANEKIYSAGFLQITHEADSNLVYNDSFKDCTKKVIKLIPSDKLGDETYIHSISDKLAYICWHEELKTLYANNLVKVGIEEVSGKYNLIIFYENGYNKSKGEDL